MGQSNNFSDMFSKFGGMPKLDHETMMQSHRKNLDALTEANKMAVEVMKSIAQLQSQYVKQTFEDFSSIMKDTVGKAASKDSFEKHGEHVKDQIQKVMTHGTTITNTLAKSQKEIMDIMHSRFSEGVQELRDMHEKSKKKATH